MKRLNLEFIAATRNELGLTLQDMADALGFKNASTYMKYEKGDYSFKANHVPVIARMLKCTIEQLFFDKNFAETANTA
ncbi:helix-turn-helix transcriptional regulator [Brevibacillus choshinensis]|uniref:helix-turn-helix transcriptional regulator n=1 Tax=Brevibacillus choshinensis TaxID=54911 RepID=UPI002E203A66|nr:helix-turn-helix transcriptional regulator [Brevibacillus choshinensis]